MRDLSPVAPLRAIRFHEAVTGDLSQVMAPPYDVIGAEKRNTLLKKSPHNIIRLILGIVGEIKDLPADPYQDAAQTLEKWLKEKALVRDERPALYVYHQTFELPGVGRVTRKGFLGLKRLEEFGSGAVMPHEKTLEGPKADRLKLTRACQANLSPIFGIHQPVSPDVTALLDAAAQRNPVVDVVDEDQTRHQMWILDDAPAVEKITRAVGQKQILIADGHHRYETALRYRRERTQENPALGVDAALNYVLMFFCDQQDPGLLILPTHRVVRGIPRVVPEKLLSGLRDFFEVESFREEHKAQFMAAFHAAPESSHPLGLMIHGDRHFYLLTATTESLEKHPLLKEFAAPLKSLDAWLLHHIVLGRLLGLSEEQQKDPAFMRFVKAEDHVWEEMLSADSVCAVLLKAPAIGQVEAISRAGLIMPPKTTYFYPKLLSGLVINPIGDAEKVAPVSA